MWFLLRKEIGLLEWNLALNLGDANYTTVGNRILTVFQLPKIFAIEIVLPTVIFMLMYLNFRI